MIAEIALIVFVFVMLIIASVFKAYSCFSEVPIDFLLTVLTGIFSAQFFHLVVVSYPASRKMNKLRELLQKNYVEIKKDIFYQIMCIAGQWKLYTQSKELVLDPKKTKKFLDDTMVLDDFRKAINNASEIKDVRNLLKDFRDYLQLMFVIANSQSFIEKCTSMINSINRVVNDYEGDMNVEVDLDGFNIFVYGFLTSNGFELAIKEFG